MKKYVYPKLTPLIDLGFLRIGGPGLANCLIISSRSFILSHNNNYEFISPTWEKFSIGPYLRGELDKRHYFGLFNIFGISGIKKLYYIYFKPKSDVIVVDSMNTIFEDLLNNYDLTLFYFNKIFNKNKIFGISNIDFSNKIGVHIRLGDYKGTNFETHLDYYKKIILEIKSIYKDKYEFYVYSDGDDCDLKDILLINGVKRVFFGNALSDLVSLSKSRLIIGSDSTFSGLAAFINQKPIVFPKRHFGNVLINKNYELVYNFSMNGKILEEYLKNIL